MVSTVNIPYKRHPPRQFNNPASGTRLLLPAFLFGLPVSTLAAREEPSQDICPRKPKKQSICIIGAGPAGLVTAHTLLRDGFINVCVLTRDSGPGGGWAARRIYPGLHISNVHGEYRFSALEMRDPASGMAGRLSGEDMSEYMQEFAETFLTGRIRYGVEVIRVRRDLGTGGWAVSLLDIQTREESVERFDKIVLCTGGASEPHTSSQLSLASANFTGPIFHSSQFPWRVEEVITAPGKVVIVGGGKSAQDMSAHLTRQGKEVSVVFESTDAFLAAPIALPSWIRRSRFLAVISPCIELNTRLERFLHCTYIGNAIVHGIWNFLSWSAFKSVNIPADSPLRRAPSIFWTIRFNDEGVSRADSFFSLVHQGKIDLISPARASGLRGNAVVLEDGREVEAGAVLLCTGYKSSWDRLFDEDTRRYIGLGQVERLGSQNDGEWKNFTSLDHPPHFQDKHLSSSIYRGIVPAASVLRKNFAINGATATTNNGYVFETTANWISSYFLEDLNLKLPATVKEALEETDRTAAWMRKRYPGYTINESWSAGLPVWSWPQYCDMLFADMGLKMMRSGGNWFTWPFKTIDSKELESVASERRSRRN